MASVEHAMLRAIGINPVAPASSAPLPQNLEEIRRLLEDGINTEKVRDRNGSSALGVAAYLGRVEAMKLLLEYGAKPQAENLDGTSCLSMAVFGKSAAAVAMLLVYGGEDLDANDALSDAHVTADRSVIAVFDAWEADDDHPLITKAEAMFAESEPIMAARAKPKAAGGSSSSGESSQYLKSRAEAAEAKAEAAEARAAAAEKRADAAEERAKAAEEALAAAKAGSHGLHMPHLHMPHFGHHDRSSHASSNGDGHHHHGLHMPHLHMPHWGGKQNRRRSDRLSMGGRSSQRLLTGNGSPRLPPRASEAHIRRDSKEMSAMEMRHNSRETAHTPQEGGGFMGWLNGQFNHKGGDNNDRRTLNKQGSVMNRMAGSKTAHGSEVRL